MKKLPLVFCCLFLACSSKKEVVINNRIIFERHQPPYHVSEIGKWNNEYMIYTLIDARDIYFTVKIAAGRTLKKGDIFVP